MPGISTMLLTPMDAIGLSFQFPQCWLSVQSCWASCQQLSGHWWADLLGPTTHHPPGVPQCRHHTCGWVAGELSPYIKRTGREVGACACVFLVNAGGRGILAFACLTAISPMVSILRWCPCLLHLVPRMPRPLVTCSRPLNPSARYWNIHEAGTSVCVGGTTRGNPESGNEVSLLGAASSRQTSWRDGCFCSSTSWLPCHSPCSPGTARLGWIGNICCTTRRLCSSQHSAYFPDHYPCPWCWTSCCCATSTSLPPSLNTSPHSAGTATAHHQRRNCHTWHKPCLHSSLPPPLAARSVCWPSSDGSFQVPARTRRLAVQSPLCTHSNPGRSLGSRLAFSGTQSTPLRLWSCRSIPGELLCRQDRYGKCHLWFCRSGNARSSQVVTLCGGRYTVFSATRWRGSVRG